MLAAHLSRLAQRRPARYAAPDPLSPLSLLVRSRLLSQPMQQHESMLPMWREMGGDTAHMASMLDAIHAGNHEQFLPFLKALQGHVAALQQHDPSYTLRAYQNPKLLDQYDTMYQHRSQQPEHHALHQAYLPGTMPDLAGNQASFQHLLGAMQRPTTQRAMAGLTPPHRSEVNRILHPLSEASRHSLPRLLQAHAQLRSLLGPHTGIGGPFTQIAPITSGAIGENVRGREQAGQHLAQMHERQQEENHPMWDEYWRNQ